MQILGSHEQFDFGERSMNVQFPRPPVFLGQIDQPAQPIRHGIRAGFGHGQSAGCQKIFRPTVDFEGIRAGSKVEFRDACTDKMVVPIWQPVRPNRLASGVLHVDAAGQQFSGIGIKNGEMHLRALRRDEASATQDRHKRVAGHDFWCSCGIVLYIRLGRQIRSPPPVTARRAEVPGDPPRLRFTARILSVLAYGVFTAMIGSITHLPVGAIAKDYSALISADAEYVFSAMVGTARCAVPARVVAGGTNDRVAPAIRKSCAAARGADIAARCPYHAIHIHGFNRGLQVENGQSPGGATEKMGLDRCVLSSLTGLVLYSRYNPAMNRWAIFERPCGTWNHDTLNGYSRAATILRSDSVSRSTFGTTDALDLSKRWAG